MAAADDPKRDSEFKSASEAQAKADSNDGGAASDRSGETPATSASRVNEHACAEAGSLNEASELANARVIQKRKPTDEAARTVLDVETIVESANIEAGQQGSDLSKTEKSMQRKKPTEEVQKTVVDAEAIVENSAESGNQSGMLGKASLENSAESANQLGVLVGPGDEPATERVIQRRKPGEEDVKTALDVEAIMEVAGKIVTEQESRLREKIEARPAEPVKELQEIKGYRRASPCSSMWDTMCGDGRIKFCEMCQTQVYDFSSMELPQAEQLVFQREGKEKVVLYKRKDGKFLSKDCPIGAKRRLSLLATAGASLLIMLAFAFAVCSAPQATNQPNLKPVKNPPELTAVEKSPASKSSSEATPAGNTTIPAHERHWVSVPPSKKPEVPKPFKLGSTAGNTLLQTTIHKAPPFSHHPPAVPHQGQYYAPIPLQPAVPSSANSTTRPLQSTSAQR